MVLKALNQDSIHEIPDTDTVSVQSQLPNPSPAAIGTIFCRIN